MKARCDATSSGCGLVQENTMSDADENEPQYSVVMNAEEQYSIWPEGRELPSAWTAAGKSGTKAECLAYIEEVWIDMRPLSLRRHMEGGGGT
jgi:MbtH protein